MALECGCCVSDLVTIKGLIYHLRNSCNNLSLLRAPLLGHLPYVGTEW